MKLSYNNYNAIQNQPSFEAIRGRNFEEGLKSILNARFGIKKARSFIAERHTMDKFTELLAELKVGVANSDTETIKWIDPIIDIERQDIDTFIISAKLPDSITKESFNLNINALEDKPECIYQILDAIDISSSKLHQTNGHIITSIEEKSELSFEHNTEDNPFNKDFDLPPLPQTEEDLSYYCPTPVPLQIAS